MGKVLVTDAYLTDIADAIREKLGVTTTYKPSQMGPAIEAITGGGSAPFAFGDIPDYVKDEALSVAEKVRAAQTENTVTTLVWADAHHCGDQSDTGWQAQTNASTRHAAMGQAIVAAACDIDCAMYAGDYTFGNATTTLALFDGQCREMNGYMDFTYGGIPALYSVGNHDTGEYYAAAGGQLYGAANVYRLIGSRNDDGTTVMGSTTYGYCYRDLTAKKVRIICLNTCEGETDTGSGGGQCSDTQLLWFAQALYSIGASADWGIIVTSHYPLDYGETYPAAEVLYQYVNGGSVTYNGTTVNFSGHNSAKFVAQYHGHTHCLKVAKINRVQNGSGTEFDAYRLATPSGTFYRNNDYAGHLFYGIDFGESVTYNKTANTGDDTAFVVNVYDPDKGIITSVCYGAGRDRVVSIGATVYHLVTLGLSHVTSSNEATAVEDGTAYATTLAAYSGYDMQTVTVTMGGTDITSTAYDSSTGAVSIASVTGDIAITATATKHVSYHNLVPTSTDASGNVFNGTGYADGTRIGSSGTTSELNHFATTGFIPFTQGQTIRLGGDGVTFAEYGCMLYFYNADKSARSNAGVAYNRVGDANYGEWSTESNTAITYKPKNTPSYADGYIRISAKGSGADLIVTLDEPID
jgi:hypothetical protein